MTKPATASNQSGNKRTITHILIAGLMLFSMFFGAGNLIFPPMLGVEAGSNFTPAMIGFLLTGVGLPVVSMIAIAISGDNIHDLARRGGVIFGYAFPVLVYLSIGALYAMPRTGAVSFSTAVVPLTGWNSTTASAIFNIIFFGVAFALVYKPNNLMDSLGRIVTPALLILITALVILAVAKLKDNGLEPSGDFTENPLATGFVNGYLTMDSLAALAFGIIVISALRYKGVPEGATMVRSATYVGIIAGVLLGAVYVGLGLVGQVIPNPTSYGEGAALLSDAASLTMGEVGRTIFGLIVLLACIGTAAGLMGACSEFFHELLPGIPYRAWAIIFTLTSIIIATAGLEVVLAIAVPIIGFLYPPAMTLVALRLLEPLVKPRMRFSYYFGLYVATAWALMMSLRASGIGEALFDALIGWAPGDAIDLGWAMPTLVAAIIGLVIDVARGEEKPVSGHELIAQELADELDSESDTAPASADLKA